MQIYDELREWYGSDVLGVVNLQRNHQPCVSHESPSQIEVAEGARNKYFPSGIAQRSY